MVSLSVLPACPDSPTRHLQTGGDELDGVGGQQSHQAALLVVHQGCQVQGGAAVDGGDGGVGPGGDETGDDGSVAVECCLHQSCPTIHLVSLVHIRTSTVTLYITVLTVVTGENLTSEKYGDSRKIMGKTHVKQI